LLLLYVDGDQTTSTRTIIATTIRKSIEGLARLSLSWKVAERALLAINMLASGCLADSPDAEALDLLHTIRGSIRETNERLIDFASDHSLDFSALLNDELFLMPFPC